MDPRTRLRSAGLRVTSTRIAVLETLSGSSEHMEAEAVRRAVAERVGSASVQGVYDALRALAGRGVIRCTELPGQPVRFEARTGDSHDHFVCRSCGVVLDVDRPAGTVPRQPVGLPAGTVVDDTLVTFRGVCAPCAGL